MKNLSTYINSISIRRLGSFLSDAINIFILKKIPVFYYFKIENVGDKMNSYLLKKVLGKKVYLVKTKRFSHILPVGSILHLSSDSSHVWGSGLISPDRPNKVKFKKILALRGFLTLAEIEKQTGKELDVPLGDPGLLMPRYYKAKPNNMRYRIGIVPHFVDQDSEIVKSLSEGPDVKVIYVQNNYDIFINEIASCDFILSSSLHGLILSDAYGIPNKWISLSDKVIGGEFKFKDYYSTTNKPEEACAYLKKTSDLLDLTSDVSSRASIKKYTGSLRRLESACSIG